MFVSERFGFLEDITLYIIEKSSNTLHDTIETYVFFFERITTHHLYGVVLEVSSTHNKTYGNTLELIVCKLKSWTLVVGVVIFHAHAQILELLDDGLQLLRNSLQLLLVLIDRNHDHLNRSQLRWQDKAIVV